MVLIIDNYDSFVYNLARYFEILGKRTYVVRNDKITLEEIKVLQPECIVISPGPGTPNTSGQTLSIITHFYTQLPILGICLGHQAIGQAFGGNVGLALQPLHGKSSMIEHNESGIFHTLPNPLTVGRYHSLIVRNLPSNSDLILTATSTEGEIMALQHKQYPTFGLQFHPESVLTEYGLDLIYNFITKFC